jgi:hypothetical protein
VDRIKPPHERDSTGTGIEQALFKDGLPEGVYGCAARCADGRVLKVNNAVRSQVLQESGALLPERLLLVLKVWTGAYVAGTADQLAKAFRVSLPTVKNE